MDLPDDLFSSYRLSALISKAAYLQGYEDAANRPLSEQSIVCRVWDRALPKDTYIHSLTLGMPLVFYDLGMDTNPTYVLLAGLGNVC